MDGCLLNLIGAAAREAKLFLDRMGEIERLDILYNGTPAYGTRITQEAIDAVPSLAQAGLTKAQLDAVIYTLKMIKTQIDTIDLPAFVVMASL
jgi:hypothetical protein